MRIKDLLNEKAISSTTMSGERFLIFENPSHAQLERQFSVAKYKELRGIYCNGNLFTWCSEYQTHYVTANTLGLKESWCCLLYLHSPNGKSLSDDEPAYITSSFFPSIDELERIKTNQSLQSIYGEGFKILNFKTNPPTAV